MRKNLKITLLTILIILLMLLPIKLYAVYYNGWNNNWDRTKILDFYKREVKLNSGSYVQLGQIKNGETSTRVAALQQPNIYCAQHGASISGISWWKISESYEAQDPILAYILNHGPKIGELETDYSSENSQIALWHYLYAKNTVDKQRILGNLSQATTHQGTRKTKLL